MALNIENVRKVRDHIAGLPPERLDMAHWLASGEDVFSHVDPATFLADCGTAACIGGWTNALFHQEYGEEYAIEALGLTQAEGDELFYPAPIFGRPFGSAEPAPTITPSQAVAVLDHLIETGEVDWSVAEQVPS